MKKHLLPFLTVVLTLNTVGIINAKQAVIEERQPTFAEALEFFKQKSKSAEAATEQKVKPKMVELVEEAVAETAVSDDNEAAQQMQTAVQKLEAQNSVLTQKIDTLSAQLQQEQEKTTKLRNQMSEAAQQDTTADTAVAEQLAQTTQETSELQEQVVQLQEQLHQATRASAQLQEQLANLTQELNQSNQEVQEKDSMIATLQAKVKQAISSATQAAAPAAPAILAAPPLAAAVEVEEEISVPAQTQPTGALQEHLTAIRAGMGLKPVEATEKKQPEKTGFFGVIAAGLASRFGWMLGQEEPEDEWDNEVEDFIQSTP